MLETQSAKLFLNCNVIVDGCTAEFANSRTRVKIQCEHNLLQKLASILAASPTCELLFRDMAEWDSAKLEALLIHLIDNKVVLHEKDHWFAFQEIVENPKTLLIEKQELQDLSKEAAALSARDNGLLVARNEQSVQADAFLNRRSIRRFSGNSIQEESLFDILWSAYGTTSSNLNKGEVRKTVPSGGGICSLRLYLALFKKVGKFEPGVFRINYPAPMAVSLERLSPSLWEYKKCFLDYGIFDSAVGSILVASELGLVARKYGGRSVLLASLEAGHVGQNVYMSCDGSSMGCCEYGGFIESRIGKSDILSENESPLTTLVFGELNSDRKEKISIEKNIADFEMSEFSPPFEVVVARGAGQIDWSTGKGDSLELADAIATSEAREWHALSGKALEIVETAPAVELHNALDLREFVQYDESQFDQPEFPYSRFDGHTVTQWVSAVDYLNGEEHLVPRDLVAHPVVKNGMKPFYSPSSNGCAAHPKRDYAIQNATLEIVERDAIMVSWLNKMFTKLIDEYSISQSHRDRIITLRELDFEVAICDITLDFVPVILVCARNRGKLIVTLGAAAGFCFFDALEKALTEVEVNVAFELAKKIGPQSKTEVEDVVDPASHERLYANPKYYDVIDVLFRGKPVKMPVTCWSWSSFTESLQQAGHHVLVSDLSTENDLTICRVNIPGFVPISFGARMEPLGMKRIFQIPATLKMIAGPNKLSQLQRLPHPFR